MIETRKKWTINEIEEIHGQPLLELVYQSATVFRKYHDPREIQVSALLSIKTGGCAEDCKYCSQSSFYETDTKAEPMMEIGQILEQAKKSRDQGASRFCLSTAWRQIPDTQMKNILEIVNSVSKLGMEVCATMGMLTRTQAQKLREAGLHTYNHNLDTGEKFYDKIVSTRTYQERLDTLNFAQEAGLNICSGGILGMGESKHDRMDMLRNLANLKKQPESVPINVLVPIEGTAMQKDPDFSFWDLLRTICTARILMPESNVRLSAGRNSLSAVEQSFCFFAGANSIFSGDKLLTTDNVLPDQDEELLSLLGLYKKYHSH